MRLLRTTLLLLAAGMFTLAGCSGDGETSVVSSAPSEVLGTWSMTGAPRAAPPTTVLAVKIDNTSAASPQVGLEQADLVIQEPVEGGLTRLVAFYESDFPRVGPVRSIRNSDVGLVQPASAVVVATGGSRTALDAFAAAGIPLVTEDAPQLGTDPGRPNQIFADLTAIEQANNFGPPTQDYLNFGDFNGTNGTAATRVTVTFNEQSAQAWQLEGDIWRRGGEDNYRARTLLVLKVKLEDAGYRDSAGSPVPVVVTTGAGDGWLVTGGSVFPVRWSKSSETSTFEIRASDGTLLNIPVGRSWISLVPEATGALSSS